jgi:hypothetical protein
MNITTPVERQAKGGVSRSPNREGRAFSIFHLRFVRRHLRISAQAMTTGKSQMENGKWYVLSFARL